MKPGEWWPQSQADDAGGEEELTQYVDRPALRRILDALAAVTGCEARIENPSGQVIVRGAIGDAESGTREAFTQTMVSDQPRGAQTIPISLDGRRIAHIRLDEGASPQAIYFLHLVADAMGRMCRQAAELRGRVDQMQALYEMSMLLAGERNLQSVLNTAARSAAQVMGAKAASIRMLDENQQQLFPRAGFNLSHEYFEKSPIRLADSPLDRASLAGQVVYVEDMRNDPRVVFPQDAVRENLVSLLSVGMAHRGYRIGVMRVYSGAPRSFSEDEMRLLQALANLAAAVIRNTQLYDEHVESQRIQQQVELAADVQRKLLPNSVPTFSGLDVAAHYEPCFELAGDFFDFVELKTSLGVVVGDVVGKGVAAGLMMAGVLASLRAHIETVYDLDQIMQRVNRAMVRDTHEYEFATVFYGTIDTESKRMTYCSAGHEPALLLRNGKFESLHTGNMLLGVDPDVDYHKAVVDLKSGDVVVIYSDGVTDAMSYQWERFGLDRLRSAVAEAAHHKAEVIVRNVVWHMRRFVGFHTKPDDVTLVVIKVE